MNIKNRTIDLIKHYKLFRPAYILCSFALVVTAFCGCRTGTSAGRPQPLAFQDKLTKSLIEKYSKPGAIPGDETSMTEAQRNQILNDLVYLTDVNYYKFTGGLYEGRAIFDTASDLALLGLGAAGTLTPAASTKSILAAISGGIAGSRVSINKNFFQEQATTALISKMDASRKTQLALMQDAMAKLSVKDYPLSRGLAQLAEYYNAGTIIGALEGITATAGEAKAKADQDLKNTVNYLGAWTYTPDVSSAKILNYLFQDGDSTKPIAANINAFKAWRAKLADDKLKDIPIEKFINDPSFKTLREQAIQEIPIK